jgi:hypothetical protein
MKKMFRNLCSGVVRIGETIRVNGRTWLVVGFTVAGAAICQAQTDATVIATNAQTAFATIAPITITIAGFYVILHLAKRVVK